MIKMVTATLFSVAVEVDENNKILNAPKVFSQFINMPLSVLEDVLKKKRFHSLKIEDVEETE